MKKIAALSMIFAGITSCTYRYENCTFNGVKPENLQVELEAVDSTVSDTHTDVIHEEILDESQSDLPENY